MPSFKKIISYTTNTFAPIGEKNLPPNWENNVPNQKKKKSIPLTYLPPIAPNSKKIPPIEITFLNSTNTFAPNYPQL